MFILSLRLVGRVGKEQLSNLAGHTVKYSSENLPITPRVLTERYNQFLFIYLLYFYFYFLLFEGESSYTQVAKLLMMKRCIQRECKTSLIRRRGSGEKGKKQHQRFRIAFYGKHQFRVYVFLKKVVH